jgi:hypothetical protein
MVERLAEANARTRANYEKQIAELQALRELDDKQQAKLKSLQAVLASLGRTVDVEQQAKAAMLRKLKITAIAVSARDVFVAAAARKGTGYELWRLTPALDTGEVVLEGLRGCCGQCDVQVSGNELVVADNTRHRVARYDRDGKLLGAFGQSSRDGGEGFGGCCNPMNTRVDAEGHIYTAESEGIIKCFAADGTLLATIGTAKLAGGCKHVAIAVGNGGERVYMLDLNNSAIAVMARKGAAGKAPEIVR